MATMTFGVNVDAGNSPKTLKSLKEDLEKINEELEGVEVGSEAFNKLADKARSTSSEIKTLEKTFEGLEPQQKVEAFVLGFEAIAGAVAVTAGTMSLFGVESEKIGKLEEKVQGAIAIAVGARAIAEGALQARIAARMVAEKAAAVATKAQIAVQTVLNAVMTANPIGLIVVAIAGLVTAYAILGEKVMAFIKQAMGPLNTALETAIGWLKKLGQWIGVVATDEEEAAAKSKKLSEGKVKQYENELKVAKARGKDTIEIEKKILREKMKLYKKDSDEYKALQADLLALTAQRAREEEEKRKAEQKKRQEAYAAQKNEAKKVQEDIAKEAELIGLDAQQKAIALENRKYQEQLATLKKFKLDTTELERLHQDNLNQIEAEAQKKRDDAAKAADEKKKNEEIQKEKDYQSLLTNIRDARAVSEDQKRDLEIIKLQEYYDQLITAAREAGIETQDLEAAKETAISLKRDEFRTADMEKQKAYQQQIADLTIGAATNVLSTLSSLNELFTGKDEESKKKAFKRQQALQIAQTIIDTFRSATGAFSSLASIPVVGPALGGVAAAAAVAAGLANIKKIKEQKYEGASASGGSTPSAGGGGGGMGIPTSTGNITPMGQLAQGSVMTPQFNQKGGGMMKAYVVSGDVKDGLEADRKIEQRRTL